MEGFVELLGRSGDTFWFVGPAEEGRRLFAVPAARIAALLSAAAS